MVFLVGSGQYKSKVVQRRKSDEPLTRSWVAKAHMGRQGWPVSDPTDEPLEFRLLKKIMVVHCVLWQKGARVHSALQFGAYGAAQPQATQITGANPHPPQKTPTLAHEHVIIMCVSAK